MQVLKMEESKLQNSPRGYFVGLTWIMFFMSIPIRRRILK